MAGYNSTTLLANLTKKPEMRTTKTGKNVLDLNLACTTNYSKDRQETLFIDVTCWGRLAEHCDKYLDKGSRVLVEGRLTNHDWVDKSGNKRRTTKITAQTVLFVTKAGTGERVHADEEPAPSEQEAQAPDDDLSVPVGADQDPVPF